MKQLSWSPLGPGDTVDVIAPGMPPRAGAIKNVASFLSEFGLRANVPKGLLAHDILCANSREMRLKFLKKAIQNPESQMIWCLRGGYGSFQLLHDLKKMQKPKTTKCFMGLSDITSLHTFLNQEWGWSTIHGPNMHKFLIGEGSQTEINRIKKIIFAKSSEVEFSLKPLNQAAKLKKIVRSQVVGGNVITLQASFGTDFQLKTQGKILFFEDIGERAYKLDRVFEQMQQLGLWRGVKAVVFGQFTGGREPNGQTLLPRYLRHFARQQKIPVLAGLPSGHGANQHPLPFNSKSFLHLGATPKLIVHTGVKL